ncbi:MAG: long-chain fatty acid--CoA ligase [Alphaproteobacteria bacterium]|nr:MAG: long-chain fatty acid--CoA ligase [Alphaproteobacteria bacterium]
MTPDAVTESQTPAPAKTAEQLWKENYPAGLKWDAEIPVTNLVQMFKDSVAKYGDRPCLNFFGKQWTYKQVDEMSDRFAKSLQDQGIGKGNHVGLCLPDLPFHVIAYYGALKAGATLVNINPLYAPLEMAHIIKDSTCDVMVTFNNRQLQDKLDKLTNDETGLKKTIVCDIADVLPPKKKYGLAVLTSAKKAFGPLLPLIAKLPGDVKVKKDADGKVLPLKGFAKFKRSLLDFGKSDTFKVVEDDKHIAFSTMMKSKGPVAPVEISPDDIAVLQFTGGTTGVPKACMLTHANLTANIAQSEMWFSGGKDEKSDKQKKMLAILPFFHVFAMTVQENLALKLGAELVMRPIPDVNKAVRVIDKHKADMFAAVPSMYESILKAKVPKVNLLCRIFNKVSHPLTKTKTEYDLSSVDLWLTGGAATPETLEAAWKKRTGKAFTKGYGLSETSPLAVAIPLGRDIVGSIGLPVPGTQVRVTSIAKAPDISDEVLGLGENGEICIKGPQVMKGYWKHDDETAKVMDKDGYFHTGDTGYIDPKTGCIYITGRMKDMINRQGMKVFPLKVENAMLLHPAISEVCVVGVPDPKVDEEVKAHIVLKEGAKATPEELKKFLLERLAPYEVPHLWKFRDSLPKTNIGKPDKKALKSEDKAELEAKAAAPAPAPKP